MAKGRTGGTCRSPSCPIFPRGPAVSSCVFIPTARATSSISATTSAGVQSRLRRGVLYRVAGELGATKIALGSLVGFLPRLVELSFDGAVRAAGVRDRRLTVLIACRLIGHSKTLIFSQLPASSVDQEQDSLESHIIDSCDYTHKKDDGHQHHNAVGDDLVPGGPGHPAQLAREPLGAIERDRRLPEPDPGAPVGAERLELRLEMRAQHATRPTSAWKVDAVSTGIRSATLRAITSSTVTLC